MRTYPALIVRPRAPQADFTELLMAALDDFSPVAFDEIDGGAAVRAFFESRSARNEARAAVAAAFAGARVDAVDIPDENWAERSQASLTRIRAGRLTIAPPWDMPGDATRTIVILPSMGFGTGHHATTRLCLLALQDAQPDGTSVLDVGTGSGVLALAAATLGAARVTGIDTDQDAVDNARENMALNALDVDFRCEGLEAFEGGPYDLVLANLTGAVLARHAARLWALRGPRGRLIVSGLREEEEQDVSEAFGREPQARTAEDGWLCLVL